MISWCESEPSFWIISFGVSDSHPIEIDASPVITQILADIDEGMLKAGTIAARFHTCVSEMIVETAVRLAGLNGCSKAVLSGGVFQNRYLCELIMRLAEDESIEFLMHRTVPPNDGGVSLGQAAIAAARMARNDV